MVYDTPESKLSVPSEEIAGFYCSLFFEKIWIFPDLNGETSIFPRLYAEKLDFAPPAQTFLNALAIRKNQKQKYCGMKGY